MKLSEQFNQRQLAVINYILSCIRQGDEKFKTSSVVNAFSFLKVQLGDNYDHNAYRTQLQKERKISLESNTRKRVDITIPKFVFAAGGISSSCGTIVYHGFTEQNQLSYFTEQQTAILNLLRLCLFSQSRSNEESDGPRQALVTFYHIQTAMLFHLNDCTLVQLQALYPNIQDFTVQTCTNSNTNNPYFGVLLSLNNQIN